MIFEWLLIALVILVIFQSSSALPPVSLAVASVTGVLKTHKPHVHCGLPTA